MALSAEEASAVALQRGAADATSRHGTRHVLVDTASSPFAPLSPVRSWRFLALGDNKKAAAAAAASVSSSSASTSVLPVDEHGGLGVAPPFAALVLLLEAHAKVNHCHAVLKTFDAICAANAKKSVPVPLHCFVSALNVLADDAAPVSLSLLFSSSSQRRHLTSQHTRRIKTYLQLWRARYEQQQQQQQQNSEQGMAAAAAAAGAKLPLRLQRKLARAVLSQTGFGTSHERLASVLRSLGSDHKGALGDARSSLWLWEQLLTDWMRLFPNLLPPMKQQQQQSSSSFRLAAYVQSATRVSAALNRVVDFAASEFGAQQCGALAMLHWRALQPFCAPNSRRVSAAVLRSQRARRHIAAQFERFASSSALVSSSFSSPSFIGDDRQEQLRHLRRLRHLRALFVDVFKATKAVDQVRRVRTVFAHAIAAAEA
jgi:hypothetical protein